MVKRTIRMYLLFGLLVNFGISFIAATYAVFLISRGLNLFEVNLVNFFFFATIFVWEIPTGAVADVFGRKISFVISCFLLSISLFIYAASYSFWGFALAETIAAIGQTFWSGAFQAWFVDKLKHHNYGGTLNSLFAREQQIKQGTGALGAMAGALLADKNIAFPWIAGGIIVFVTGVLALILMKEEYFVRKSFSLKREFQSVKDTIRISFGYGIKNETVRFIVLMGIVQWFAIMAANMQWQPFFSQFLPNKTSLGFIFGGAAACCIIGATISARFLRLLRSEKQSLVISQLIMGAGILLTTLFKNFPLALLMFLFHEAGRGLFRPIKDTYFNNNIPSKERATLLSFDSMMCHMGGMAGLVFSGAMAEYVSISAAWVSVGSILIIITLLLARHKK